MTDKKPTKKALLEAFRAEMGKCSSLLDEDRACPHWGVEKVDGRAYCGQHVGSVYRAADEARRDAARKSASLALIDRALAWHAAHPSVHEPMPR